MRVKERRAGPQTDRIAGLGERPTPTQRFGADQAALAAATINDRCAKIIIEMRTREPVGDR